METQTAAPSDADLGPVLYENGWRQGALVASQRLLTNGLSSARIKSVTPIDPDSTLVIVSQTCDIVARPDREPAVEALICDVDPTTNVASMVNSSRYFVVDPVEKLVAYASKRVLMPKSGLRGVSPDSFAWEADRFALFQHWLADRWRRPDFPDALGRHFGGPLAEVLKKTRKKEPDAWTAFDFVYQLRVSCSDDTPGSPIETEVVALLKPSINSQQIAEIRRIVGAVIDKANGAEGRPLSITSLKFTTPARMSLADAWEFRPLYLDYLSLEGEQEVATSKGPD